MGRKVLVWSLFAIIMVALFAASTFLLMQAWNQGFVPVVDGTHPITYSGALWLTSFQLVLIASFRGSRSDQADK